MLAIGLWMMGIAIGVSVMVITVAMELYSVQFGLGAVIATFIAISGMRDHGDAETGGASAARRSAILIRHMAILWSWAAMSVCLIYSLLMVWTETWIPLFIILVLAAGTCMFIANLLERDAEAGTEDTRVVGFVERMVWAQFVVICLLIGGLVTVGKFGAASFSGENKWAAMNILLCTGIGLAIVSGFSIVNSVTGGKSLLTGANNAPLKSASTAQADTPAPRRRRPQARVL